MYCGEYTAVKHEPAMQTAVTLRCNAWTCPDCADRRKAGLIAQAIGGKPDTFLTLTMRRKDGLTPDQAALELSRAWRILRLRAMREAKRDSQKQPLPSSGRVQYVWKADFQGKVARKVVLHGEALPFLAVVEKHKSGWPHLHILIRSKWLDHKWLSLNMLDILDSPVVSVERLFRKSKAAVYCSKYCGKCANKFKTAKRYWQSRDYDQRDPEEKEKHKKGQPGWSVERNNLFFYFEMWELLGWHYRSDRAFHAVGWNPRERDPPPGGGKRAKSKSGVFSSC